ncbi:MAG: hypothetical protein AAGE59_37940 [Cyanobacteria bacterium P01_F01_bin.86]
MSTQEKRINSAIVNLEYAELAGTMLVNVEVNLELDESQRLDARKLLENELAKAMSSLVSLRGTPIDEVAIDRQVKIWNDTAVRYGNEAITLSTRENGSAKTCINSRLARLYACFSLLIHPARLSTTILRKCASLLRTAAKRVIINEILDQQHVENIEIRAGLLEILADVAESKHTEPNEFFQDYARRCDEAAERLRNRQLIYC